MLQFLAKSSPETALERVGALVWCLTALFGLASVSVTVFNAFDKPWTFVGVAASAFGLMLCAALCVVGVFHGMSALFTSLVKHERQRPSLQVVNVIELQADRLKFAYRLWGLLTLMVLILAGFYLLISSVF